MQIQIQTSDLETPTGWREQVEKRVRFVLRRLRHGIRHARVSLRDVNGPRGGVDKECRVTLKRDGDAWTGFESWSFGAIAQEPERFERAMRDMCEATPEQCRSGEWAHLHEKARVPLAQRAASAREASRAHAGQEARAPMARERAVGAE